MYLIKKKKLTLNLFSSVFGSDLYFDVSDAIRFIFRLTRQLEDPISQNFFLSTSK